MSRPPIRRGSPISKATTMAAQVGPPARTRRRSNTESSDDDNSFSIIPVKLSAMTNALLNNEPSVIESSSPPAGRYQRGTVATRAKEQRVPEASNVHTPRRTDPGPSSPRPRIERHISDDASKHARVVRLTPGSMERSSHQRRASDPSVHTPIVPRARTATASPPRVVRISGGEGRTSAHRRSQSTSDTAKLDADQVDASPRYASPQTLVTPAPKTRKVRIQSSYNSPGFADAGPKKVATGERLDSKDAGAVRSHGGSGHLGSGTRGGPSTIVRGRHAEETGVHNSMRVKRVGKVSGSFLSGPARRGRRRQSEEEPSPRPQSADGDGSPGQLPASGSKSPPLHIHQSDPKTAEPTPAPAPAPSSSNIKFAAQHAQPAVAQPVYRVPNLPPSLPSHHDQENEPPPTFKRVRPAPAVSMLSKVSDAPLEKKPLGAAVSPARVVSPQRQVLAARSQNTPHRAAPPPPKMSILQTATATAGADTTSVSRKKRSYISLNGKIFTRMDCIGRGGSCRVYQVMAENFKLFALKRVSIQDLDETTVKGYKGEIDLLKRLSKVERVVRLIDYEVNDEKQTLSVLMEIGEIDLARILKVRFQPDSPDSESRLDLSFARHYWREMLECVAAVHAHEIVHSDLKPANFLLVQGRLKLIDFGIANAIQDDTVNVHRDQTVGTPNYMAPEAIQDANAARGLPASVGKMMKLGKPSDVWSLGCILYQMAYGRPPFAAFARPVATIMAITNPEHVIEFPASGLGGVPIPAGLMKTMRGCLMRDQTRRPTLDALLAPTDPWLYPDHAVAVAVAAAAASATAPAKAAADTVEVSQETLDKILRNVVRYCQRGNGPDERELREWPGLFMEKLRGKGLEGGGG